MSSLPFSNSVGRSRRRRFATSPVSAGAELLAAALYVLDRFLVFGIFSNLGIIKDKVINQDVFIAACKLFEKSVK